jgi:hypothetical protein
MDIVRVEYRRKGVDWQPIPAAAYNGKATNYLSRGFNANNYTEWRATDSISLPSQSWWKEELFDVSFEVGNDDAAQFRFVLKHGNTPGTQISYGWLIDNIEIIAAPHEVKIPVVEFVTPLVKGSVYSTGPWVINAKVKTQTTAQIENPYLVYTATNHQGIVVDSVLMTMVVGDSLWEAAIPQFVSGTEVVYSIMGRDITGNTATITSGYVIDKPNHNYGDTSAVLTTITSPIQGQTMGNVITQVEVILRNRGDSALTSASIHWSVNGVERQPYSWNGNLSWDFEQYVTIGNYQPRMDAYDTIVIWIETINGIPNTDLTGEKSVITYGCSANMSGQYTVGMGGIFSTLADALTVLGVCSPIGDITLALTNGIYAENWDITNISNFMGNHTLTITSLANDKDSVILRPPSAGTTAIVLNNSNNIKIEHITIAIDFSQGNSIGIVNTCSNIVITHCNILMDTTRSYGYAIYKSSGTAGIASNISITHNIINGSAYGIYIYAGSGNNSYGFNYGYITIDSNTIKNQYQYGIYIYYTDSVSISNNSITSRTNNTSSNNWYGISLYYCNGNVTNNRILQKSTTTNRYPYGIVTQFFTGLIANNEIILNTTSTYSGIYANNYTKAKILHNSIYVSGSGAGRGIQIVNNANNYMVIRNNNIVMEATGAYPVYLNATANLQNYDMDYNNMYAPTYVGYAGGNKATIAAWQQTVTTDSYSINVRPGFIDSTVNLKVVNYLPLLTPALPEVGRDMDGIYRLGAFTSMGCYHEIIPFAVNASLGSISSFRTGNFLGQQDTIKVELFNRGTSALTTATLKWSVNGTTQSTNGTWSGLLLSRQNTVITLGAINYTQAGDNIIRVWIDNLGALQDEYHTDDTLTVSRYICQNAFSGSYSIGNGGNFPSWEAAIERVKICGVDGDVTFAFLPGIYTENIDLTDKLSLFGNHTLTITSSTRNATDVIFRTATYGILLNNSNHVIIDAITIDAIQGNYAIQFTAACTNVVIRNCNLLSDSASISNTKYVIGKFGTGVASNISITNNIINGGYYGIYFYAGTAINQYGKHIAIDSNIIKNQSHYATYVYYADSVNISGNTVTSRTNTNSEWHGLELLYCNGAVINNRILQKNNTIVYSYGIIMRYFNYYNTKDTGIIANNEIILNMKTSTSGIYINTHTNAKILHNSIYILGTEEARGIYFVDDANSYVILKNNNIIMESSLSYPVYLDSATNLQNYDIDYNNMYAPTYVGYAGTPVAAIQRWQQIITSDKHSVSIRPVFINNTIDMQLSNYAGLECYSLIETPTDIQETARTGITAMGCYQGFNLYNTNAMLTDIQGVQSGFILGTTDTIKAVLGNMGNTPLINATLNWSFNGVTQSTSDINWSGNLATGKMDTIVLGVITYIPAGHCTIEAWISGIGGLQDQYLNDDTTKVSGYICSSTWNGTISIGTTGAFKSIKEALPHLYLCGLNGDVTLALEPGTYNESIDLTNISQLMGNYKLTITSSTNNANDVVFVTNNVGVMLSNSNNIVLKNITIDATAGNYAVQFAGYYNNVVIRDCKLSATTTSIYIYGSHGDSLFIINNQIDGGTHGLYSSYAGGSYVFIDSNTIRNNQSTEIYQCYGIRAETFHFTSCSYNTIINPTNIDGNLYWYGINLSICEGSIIGNRIIQLHNTNTTSVGIHLNAYYNNGTQIGLIANNEIILNKGYGIYLNDYSRAEILHNSIHIAAGGSGIYFHIQNNTNGVIKNNNIVMESSTAYPIYFNNISYIYIGKWNIDANNYYAPTYIGYAGSPQTSFTVWESIVNSDVNSVSIKPDFIDSTVNLQLDDYKGLECIPVAKIPVDINGKSRTGITVMGCHHEYTYLANAKLTHASQWEGIYVGTTDTVKVQMTNTAITNITTATVYWSFNGSTPQSYTWNGSLSVRQSAILTLGTITFTSGNNTLDIWIDNLGSLQDEISADDSIHKEFVSCNAGFNGTYTIGTGGNYTSIELAVAALNLCGTSGDVTFALLPGTYTGTIDLSNVSPGAYTLTLTSSTNDTNDVTIVSTETGILLANSHNIIIKNLTVYAINGLYGIRLDDACSDIMIRECRIQAGTTASYGIYKTAATGTIDNIVISNNIISGGANGIYFYGGTDSNAYSTHIVIDSNTISKQTNYAIDVSYTDFTRISANNISEVDYGISLSWSNGPVINNRLSLNPALRVGIGINASSNYNTHSTTIAGLIANNEIRLNAVLAVGLQQPELYGIYAGTNIYTDILHNSIYSSGDGCAFGIVVSNTVNQLIRIKNNNIRIDGGLSVWIAGGRQIPVPSAPIYLSSIPAQYDIDYNNTYSPSYVGGIGGSFTGGNVSIAAWKAQITTDLHSISLKTDFIDPSVNLMLNDYLPFLCPMSRVATDIDRNPRSRTTIMGAYSNIISDYDLMLQNITRMEDEVVNNQTVQVGIDITTLGKDIAIDSAIFRWSINSITQPNSYKWTPSSPLQPGESVEVLIDTFTVTGISYVEINVWAEKINEGKDSIPFDDTVSKIASIVPMASFAPPLVADTIHALSFDVYVKIIEGTGSLILTPVPKMNIQTQMTNGTILYDTIDMVYNNSNNLWVAHIPQQYYGSKVIYSVTISDTVGNNIPLMDETYLKFVSGGEAFPGSHIAVTTLQGLVESGCIQDYVTATITLSNLGTTDYDFAGNPLKLYMQVTQPVPFYLDTVMASDVLQVGGEFAVEITNMFPTVVAGQYDIRIWIDSISPIVYDDTLVLNYVSGKFSLPVDDDFSNGIPIVFASREINSHHKWESVPQGIGVADTAVIPYFGTGMLTFGGSPGSMTTLSTQQLDLSRTVQPSLTFWYFHDTVLCEDYTDVRITVDGGDNYMTLFSLTKYDAVYGWRQYSMDLPPYAVNQCVIIVFEAMEKSRSGNVTQYIDRIRITARQDIKLEDILTSYTVCDLENKELKVVLNNISDIALDYAASPTTITLEVKETGQIFTKTLTSGVLGSFVSDTITMTTDFDLAKGTYTFKAYFFTALDVDRQNDTLEKSISINPRMSVRIHPESTPNSCLTGELVVYPTVTVYNMGNMPLSDIDLVFQIDTGANFDIYTLLEESCNQTILAGDSFTYHFTNSYTVPWKTDYYSRITASLSCNATLIDTVNEMQECVDAKDLYMVSIDNPSASVDRIGSAVQVQATLGNHDDLNYYTGLNITVVVTNSQGVQMDKFTEMTGRIDMSSTASHSFSRSYTVPNDSVYYLTVYLDHYDNYLQNDTTTIRRETTDVRIAPLGTSNVFTLSQNIPNPATNSTRIDYSVPEAGEVIFHVHSITGQLLYSKTIESERGTNSIELNTSTFAAGVYFYSMEYKGQRLVKQLIINSTN